MTEDVQWFAGIDWASRTHQVCLIDAGGKIVGERGFAHGGAGLAELCDWLLTVTRAPAPAIAVAIEVPHGPVVEALLERGFQVHAINPKQLDRFRDRFTVADKNPLTIGGESPPSLCRLTKIEWRRVFEHYLTIYLYLASTEVSQPLLATPRRRGYAPSYSSPQ